MLSEIIIIPLPPHCLLLFTIKINILYNPPSQQERGRGDSLPAISLVTGKKFFLKKDPRIVQISTTLKFLAISFRLSFIVVHNDEAPYLLKLGLHCDAAPASVFMFNM
jgi:hypothetical protein